MMRCVSSMYLDIVMGISSRGYGGGYRLVRPYGGAGLDSFPKVGAVTPMRLALLVLLSHLL
ncbi:hypothetical protein LCGC14_1414380 [marine sediment metagenome]|uniref:Uncharacterized protein n=1 Tax=marine sediment metagenome TaxID=412755 RepID=A0A0F9JT98_9ZZZZ